MSYATESDKLGVLLAQSLIEYESSKANQSVSSVSLNPLATQEELLDLYGLDRVPSDIEYVMLFKKKYMEALDEDSQTVILTPYENRRRDAWSLNVFGSVDYAYMFDILIPNVDYAMNYGYEVLP